MFTKGYLNSNKHVINEICLEQINIVDLQFSKGHSKWEKSFLEICAISSKTNKNNL